MRFTISKASRLLQAAGGASVVIRIAVGAAGPVGMCSGETWWETRLTDRCFEFTARRAHRCGLNLKTETRSKGAHTFGGKVVAAHFRGAGAAVVPPGAYGKQPSKSMGGYRQA